MTSHLTADLTDEQRVHFQAWRADALAQMPYFARVLFSLRVVNAPGLGTFGVDRGHRLYIDFDAMIAKGPAFCADALLHECGHLFGDHANLADDLGIGRAEHQVWNVAGDCAINDDLRDAGCTALNDFWMLPESIGAEDYQTPHHYYGHIRDLQSQQQQQQPGQGQDSGQGGEGQAQGGGGSADQPQDTCGKCGQSKPDDGSGDQDGSGSGADPDSGTDSQDGSGAGGQQPGGAGATCSDCGQQAPQFKGCGSGSGGAPAPCELDMSDDLGGAAEAAGPLEREQIRIGTAAAIREHAKTRGNVPGGLLDEANAILAPSKVRWDRILGAYVRRSIAKRAGAFDTDRAKRSRRRHNQTMRGASGGAGRRIIYPGTYTPTPQVHVIRDTSGSMSAADIAAVGREVGTIAKRVGIKGRDLMVTDCDTRVHEAVPFVSHASISQVHGRGGTDMVTGIDTVLSRRGAKPDVIVVMTDGYTPWPVNRTRIPVIAVLIPQDGQDEVPEAVVDLVPDWMPKVCVEAGDLGR